MHHGLYDDAYILDILKSIKTIAVIGASPKDHRPSFRVLQYLLANGYDAFPINPGHAGREIAGAMTYGSLEQIDRPVDMVDIFKNSEAAYSVVEQSLSLSPLPKVIWMQLEIINNKAAKLAEDHGVKVIMNRCPKIEHARLFA